MYEESLLYKITWYYYVNNMTQEAIAEHLNISRAKVIKFLALAKNEGLVKFKVDYKLLENINLSKKLLEKYRLDDIFIIPSTPDNLKDALAKGASKYIDSKVSENSFINIGYGDTISKTIVELANTTQKKLSLITLSGGVSNYTGSIMSGIRKGSGPSLTPDLYMIPAPLIVSSSKIADELLEENEVKNILKMTKLSNVSLIGIGDVNEKSTIFTSNIISKTDLTVLKMKGAVGDVLSQFYDINGELINTEIHSKLVSVKINELKKFKNIVAIAGGKNKVEAIYAALKVKFINVLITDEDTAMALLERE